MIVGFQNVIRRKSKATIFLIILKFPKFIFFVGNLE